MDNFNIREKIKSLITEKYIGKILFYLIILLAILVFGCVCIQNGYEHGYDDAETYYKQFIKLYDNKEAEDIEETEDDISEMDSVSDEDLSISEDLVWIVNTGTSYAYHDKYCQYVQRDDIVCISITEAENMGRTPCQVCGGNLK